MSLSNNFLRKSHVYFILTAVTIYLLFPFIYASFHISSTKTYHQGLQIDGVWNSICNDSVIVILPTTNLLIYTFSWKNMDHPFTGTISIKNNNKRRAKVNTITTYHTSNNNHLCSRHAQHIRQMKKVKFIDVISQHKLKYRTLIMDHNNTHEEIIKGKIIYIQPEFSPNNIIIELIDRYKDIYISVRKDLILEILNITSFPESGDPNSIENLTGKIINMYQFETKVNINVDKLSTNPLLCIVPYIIQYPLIQDRMVCIYESILNYCTIEMS